ncbi:MAG TPA: histidine kinase dimerization/phospho-acceptor domain-containing protein, partial [Terriglobales bacterium]|nr:histidine kinase dimerization/phospho-acceptor domain-containing protein [Terriglobales bacterium]
MGTNFNERTWLTWLAKVRIIIITFLLGIELAITRLTPTPLPERVFVSIILLWYTIAVFYVLLLFLWDDYRNQARLQVFSDLAFATGVVYVTGGQDTSFIFLYPLVIIMASILFSRAWAYMTAALSFILFGALVELTYYDAIHSYSTTRPDPKSLQAIIFINLFAFLAIAYLATSLTNKLRMADVELADMSGALENLQALHENIINSMSGGLLTTGLDGRVSVVNARAERLLERPAQELLGRPIASLFLDRLPEVRSWPVRAEVRYAAPQHDEKTFAVTGSALVVPDRGVLGHVYTFDDLTDIRRLEREVRMRDRLAAVGRMAAGIAHEVRNPLSSIGGSVKVLSSTASLTEEQRELLDIVTRESDRLNSIVTDFLIFSREKNYRFTRCDLRSLLEDTLTLLENRPVSGTHVLIQRDFEVEQAWAVVDGDKMKQVFWNICENAMRAMPDGGTLRVALA